MDHGILFNHSRTARIRLLPLADGCVTCAHGIIPVRPFPDEGETVSPTAVALLRCLGATFGPWPAMQGGKAGFGL